MSIPAPAQSPTSSSTAYSGQKLSETPPPRQEDHSRRSSNGENQGGERPSDFGHRDPDYNHDGTISDAESRTYQADTRSADSRYSTDSRERMAHEKEEGKNYRAEVSAHTAQVHSQNDNKMHKLFGKETAPPPPPPVKPEGL
jgi:hypothetical protein